MKTLQRAWHKLRDSLYLSRRWGLWWFRLYRRPRVGGSCYWRLGFYRDARSLAEKWALALGPLVISRLLTKAEQAERERLAAERRGRAAILSPGA